MSLIHLNMMPESGVLMLCHVALGCPWQHTCNLLVEPRAEHALRFCGICGSDGGHWWHSRREGHLPRWDHCGAACDESKDLVLPGNLNFNGFKWFVYGMFMGFISWVYIFGDCLLPGIAFACDVPSSCTQGCSKLCPGSTLSSRTLGFQMN